MNRLSAHIGYLYTDLPLAARPAAAARDGFTAVEHPEPWDLPLSAWQVALAGLDLPFAQTSSGMGGAKGLAALPGREEDFRTGFLRALDYATGLNAPFLHPMAGAGGQEAVYRANLDWALAQLRGTGIRLLVEPITTIPGYHMNSFAAAMELQDRMGDGVALLFDSFHAANAGIDPARWVQENSARIGHVHIADHPGRHEPGTGTLDFAALLDALLDAGFAGAIGFEYLPSIATTASAAFLPGWAERLSRKVPT